MSDSYSSSLYSDVTANSSSSLDELSKQQNDQAPVQKDDSPKDNDKVEKPIKEEKNDKENKKPSKEQSDSASFVSDHDQSQPEVVKHIDAPPEDEYSMSSMSSKEQPKETQKETQKIVAKKRKPKKKIIRNKTPKPVDTKEEKKSDKEDKEGNQPRDIALKSLLVDVTPDPLDTEFDLILPYLHFKSQE